MGTSARQRRIGVLGGTFDPPHIGHLVVAGEALWRLRLDEVRLMPAHLPPHKPTGTHGTAEQRLAWTRAMAAGFPGLRVSTDELDRGGPSFTADTMERIAAAEPGAALWFLLGSDQLEAMPAWHEPHRILAVARIGAVPRDGHSVADVDAIGERVAPGRVDVVDAPHVGVSSTMVRERIAAGLPVRHLVPPGVHDMLVADGLVPSATVPT
jgi:nicotinate-nucleotide adenylyltransferase